MPPLARDGTYPAAATPPACRATRELGLGPGRRRHLRRRQFLRPRRHFAHRGSDLGAGPRHVRRRNRHWRLLRFADVDRSRHDGRRRAANSAYGQGAGTRRRPARSAAAIVLRAGTTLVPRSISPGTPFYNVAEILALGADPDVAALQFALDSVIARHETLRTTFHAMTACRCSWFIRRYRPPYRSPGRQHAHGYRRSQ